MIGGMGSAVVPDLSQGGEIDGDLVITGDFKVEGAGSFAFDEIVEGTLQVNSTGTSSQALQLTGQNGQVNVNLLPQEGGTSSFIVAQNTLLSFRPNGTSVLNVKSTGQVGIGTSSPSKNLHVFGSSEPRIRIEAGSGSNPGIEWAEANVRKWVFYNDNSDDTIHFKTNSDSRMVIEQAGNVGIGTTSPATHLHVNGNIRYNEWQTSNGNAIVYTNGTDSILKIFKANGSDFSQINSNGTSYLMGGNVGIGTTSPSDYGTSATNLVIKEAGNAGLSIITGTSNTGNIHFGDGTSASSAERRGMIRYDHSSDDFIFWTAGSEKLRITSAGHLVPGADNAQDIGTTNSQDWRTLFIRKIDMQNELLIIEGASIAATYKDHSSVGNGHIFYHRNNEAMRIGVSGSADLTTTFTSSSANGSGTITGLHLKNTGTTVNDGTKLLFTSGTSTAGASIYNQGKALDSSDLVFEAGGSTERMRITRTGGVKFGGSSASDVSFEGANGFPDMTLTGGQARIMYHTSAGNFENGILFDNGVIKFMRESSTSNFSFILDANSRISLSNNDNGSSNTVFGRSAGNALASGSVGNVLFGESAGAGISTNDYNTFIGHNAGRFYGHASALNNTAIGFQSMYVGGNASTNSAYNNTAVGYQSLRLITTGGNNVAVGANALDALTIGHSNVAIGLATLGSEVVAYGVTALGYGVFSNANRSASSGSAVLNAQIGIGYVAGASTTTGHTNTFIGAYSAHANTTGSRNVTLGYATLQTATTSTDCVVIGNEAMAHAQAGQAYSGVVAIGKDAVKGNNSSTTTGINGTVGIGMDALTALTTGAGNTAIGYEAGNVITTGGKNTLFGYQAGGGGTGIDTLSDNTFMGYRAGLKIDSGARNIAIGSQAMESSAADSDANDSVAIGYKALYSLSDGDNNVAIGANAGSTQTNANFNTYIGKDAGLNATGSNNTVVGAVAFDAGSLSGSQNVVVGTSGMGSATGAINKCTAIGEGALAGSLTTSGGDPSGTVAVGYQSLVALTTGAENTAVGYLSLNSDTTGYRNTALGYEAGKSVVTGALNTYIGRASGKLHTGDNSIYIGDNAGGLNTSGSTNVAVGQASMYNNKTGSSNTAIGYLSMLGATDQSHSNNTSVGANSLYSITTGGGNVAVGKGAGYYNQTGSENTYLGKDAGLGASGQSNSNNTGVGYTALTAITTGANNVAIGANALDSITTTNNMVAVGYNAGTTAQHAQTEGGTYIGYEAGKSIYSAGHVTAIGYKALHSLSANGYNTAVGSFALTNTTGIANTAVGYRAGYSNTTGFNNQYFGRQAGFYGTTGRSNIAIGYNSQFGASGQTDGDYNVSLGENTLSGLTTGNHNFAVGSNAGLSLTSGEQNVIIGMASGDAMTTTSNTVLIGREAGSSINSTNANGAVLIGANAGSSLTSGQNAVGIGQLALSSLTTGDNNTAIGYRALDSITTSSGNTAVGYDAGKNGSNANFALNVFVGKNAGNISSGDGGDAIYNVGVGNDVLTSLNGGDKNVAIGRASGDSITTGAKNTLLGHGTDISAVNGQHQIAIGHEVVGTANNRVHIGNETSHIYNDFNSNATWTHSSDERQKKEIKDDTLGLEFINDIRPVTYKHKSPSEFPKEWDAYNADDKESMGGDKVIHGLIAQEVKQALDKQGIDTFSGWDENPDGRQSVSFEAFVLPLIKSVQELSAKIDKLKQQLKDK